MNSYTTPRRNYKHRKIGMTYQQSSCATTTPRMSPMPNKRLRSHHTTTPRAVTTAPRNIVQTTENNDRYIPSRRHSMNIEVCRRALNWNEKEEKKKQDGKNPLQKEFQRRMMSSLCNLPVGALNEDCQPSGFLSFGNRNKEQSQILLGNNENNNTPRGILERPESHDTLRTVLLQHSREDDTSDARFLKKKMHRKINNEPFKVFSAPIVNDFYLNHISWGANNILATACGTELILWNAMSGTSQHFFTTDDPEKLITSVSWLPSISSNAIAIGMSDSSIHLYDVEHHMHVRQFYGHDKRVASLAWCGQTLSSGSHDTSILQHDIRCRRSVHSYIGHGMEICSLKWNEESMTLASGANDNTICLWDASMSGQRFHNKKFGTTSPRLRLTEHTAAVKALDWCPFQRNLLASGGGNNDKTIKFWDTCSGKLKNSMKTESQVSSIVWAKDARELCTAHGSNDNQLKLWKYPTMELFKELDGHDSRVLGMEMSPDGSSVVSVSADETLQFWNVFETPKMTRSSSSSALWGELSFGVPSIR